MPKVLITMEVGPEIRAAVSGNLPSDVQVTYLADSVEADRTAAFEVADVLAVYHMGKEIREEEFPLISRIPMLQSITAGVESLPYDYISPDTVVCANAGAWAWPLAEYVMGMAVTLEREILTHSMTLAKGVWNRTRSRGLRGRTMGIIGFGGIGQATAKLAKAFGMNIMAINRSGKTDMPVEFIGVETDTEKVLAESDLVLLCTPLTKKTQGMIGSRELDLMKEDAVLINVGRGPLVDEDALYEHMVRHPNFKFGSDVWWKEPTSDGKYSLKRPHFNSRNFLGTPHNADHLVGMLPEAVKLAMQNVTRYFHGEPLHGVVKREDYA